MSGAELDLLLLLRSNAGMVMSNMEMDTLDELGSGLKFLLGSPQLVHMSRKSAPHGHRRVLFSVWVGQFCRICSESWMPAVPHGPVCSECLSRQSKHDLVQSTNLISR